MVDAATRALVWIATHGPIAWAWALRVFTKCPAMGKCETYRAASASHIAEVKDAILSHLKEKALSGASDEIGKFSQSAFNKAINQIGERKLALFFSPDEMAQLRMTGRVASYMQNQPVGSAVNNSNSGALLLGKGIDLLNKIPGGQTFIGQPLQNISISMQQRAAQNVAPGLLAAQPKQRLVPGLLSPAAAFGGGLLAAQPVN